MAFKIEECSPESKPGEYREWFEQWVKFCPWRDGARLILSRLNRASRRYRSQFDDRDVTLEAEAPLYARLLYSLTFHWTRTENAPPADEETTITSLETQGRGGSNPLEDLTLVDSLLVEVRENRSTAKRYLERRFGVVAVGVARRMGLRVSDDLDSCEWWLDSYYAMVGLNGGKPALSAYAGRAGIGAWIKRVVYSVNRPKKGSFVLQSDFADEPGLDPFATASQEGELSSEQVAEIREFSAQLRSFWRELSPVERATLLFWNAKIPKRFVRARHDAELQGVWEISGADAREAYKLCGVGLASKPFVLNLIKKRKAFLKRFALDGRDAKLFIPIYCHQLDEFSQEFPVTEDEFVADVRRVLNE